MKVFSHHVRRYDYDEVVREIEDQNMPSDALVTKTTPAMFAHVDFGPNGAVQVLEENFPEDAPRLQQSRWAMINIWRPLKPVYKDPLALCDRRTVVRDDLVPVHAVMKSKYANYSTAYMGQRLEVLYVRASPKHRWYFLSNMMPNGMCYDESRTQRMVKRN